MLLCLLLCAWLVLESIGQMANEHWTGARSGLVSVTQIGAGLKSELRPVLSLLCSVVIGQWSAVDIM